MTLKDKFKSITGAQRFWLAVQFTIGIGVIIKYHSGFIYWIINGPDDPTQLDLYSGFIFLYTFYIFAWPATSNWDQIRIYKFGTQLQWRMWNVVTPICHLIWWIIKCIGHMFELLWSGVLGFNSYLDKKM